MNNNYDYSYEWDHKYCYPHSNVLINKLKIEDAKRLRIAEREITSLRIANAKLNLIRGDFDLLHLRTIHKYIFGDIYEWAGELRCVNVAKGNMFCNYQFIEPNAHMLFQELKKRIIIKTLFKMKFHFVWRSTLVRLMPYTLLGKVTAGCKDSLSNIWPKMQAIG